jgi:type II secretory pathway component PulF
VSVFIYSAAQPDGRKLSGTIHADHVEDARARVAARGLFPLTVEPQPAGFRVRRASRRDLALLFRSLASLVAVGVPLDRALAASVGLTAGPLAAALSEAQTSLREGLTLSAALENAGGLFPPVALGMLRAGERGSQLGTALMEIASHLEAEAELVAQVRQALAYPTVLAVVGGASVLLITVVILPRFASLLTDAGATLPVTTKALLGASEFAMDHALAIALTSLLIVAGCAQWLAEPRVQLRLQEQLLRFPLVGPLLHALSTARLARALGGLLNAGLPLLPALRTAGDAAGNEVVRLRLRRVGERVARGEPLARSLSSEEAVTRTAAQLISVGETTGQLALMSARAGLLAGQEADRTLKTLVGLLEPALVITFGGLVAFVAAALLQAVYGLRPGG